MTDRIDWEALVERIREVDARPEFASTVEGARHAVELLIGTDRLRQAVDDFVADDLARTSDLIEGVLRAIRPPSVGAQCHAISRSSADVWKRCRALRLLRYVAGRRALPWIAEFLDDPERGIRTLGLEVLDQLLWTRQVEPDDCEDLLRRAEADRDSQVRSRAAMLREDVDRRRGIHPHGRRGLAIATQRRETLIGLNATHYVSLVVSRTFYHRVHRDRVLVQKASLSSRGQAVGPLAARCSLLIGTAVPTMCAHADQDSHRQDRQLAWHPRPEGPPGPGAAPRRGRIAR